MGGEQSQPSSQLPGLFAGLSGTSQPSSSQPATQGSAFGFMSQTQPESQQQPALDIFSSLNMLTPQGPPTSEKKEATGVSNPYQSESAQSSGVTELLKPPGQSDT